MEYSKSSPEGEIHGNTSIRPITGKNSNTKANLAPKGDGEKKQQIDSTPSRRRDLIKIQAELHEIETRRTVGQINKARIRFFEIKNKIDKPLASLIKQEREDSN